jgi:hypothetical protein
VPCQVRLSWRIICSGALVASKRPSLRQRENRSPSGTRGGFADEKADRLQEPLPALADVGDSRKKGAASAKYDSIRINYAELRKPDRRIARLIESRGGGPTLLHSMYST